MQYEDIDEDISGRIGDQVATCCSAGHVPLCGRDMVFGLTLRHTATCARYYIVFCSPRMEHKRDCKNAARPTSTPAPAVTRRLAISPRSSSAVMPRPRYRCRLPTSAGRVLHKDMPPHCREHVSRHPERARRAPQFVSHEQLPRLGVFRVFEGGAQPEPTSRT